MNNKILKELYKIKDELDLLEKRRNILIGKFNLERCQIEDHIKGLNPELAICQLTVKNINGRFNIVTLVKDPNSLEKVTMLIYYTQDRYIVTIGKGIMSRELQLTSETSLKLHGWYITTMRVLKAHGIIYEMPKDNPFEIPDTKEIKVYGEKPDFELIAGKRTKDFFKTGEQISALKKEYNNLDLSGTAMTRYQYISKLSDELNVTMDVVIGILNV